MGKLKEFSIIYDHPNAVYRAGDTVRGQVHIHLAEQKKIKNIQLWCRGRGTVHWKHTNHSTGITSNYISQEVYFESNVFIAGSDDGKIHLPEGQHNYPFEIRLAEDLPSSFEGVYGYVRYMCTAIIELQWQKDHETSTVFTVIGHLDLNTEPLQLKKSHEEAASTSVSYCCCYSGRVNANFRVNRRGFVPGECAIINAEVENNSNSMVLSSRVSIKQYTEYFGVSTSNLSTGETISNIKSSFVAGIQRGHIQPGDSDNWVDVPLPIPSLPPSYLVGCNIINIAYAIKFYVLVDHGKEIKMSCEIIIGTVPLREAVEEFFPELGSKPGAEPLTSDDVPEVEGATPQYTKYPMPPPSYEESVSGKVHIGEGYNTENSENKWAPSYPVYRHLSVKHRDRH